MLFYLLALATVTSATAPFYAREGAEVVEGEYIVVFKGDLSADARAAHYSQLNLKQGESLMHKYSFSGFSGYAAKLERETLTALLEVEAVQYIEVNQYAHAHACQTVSNLPSGLWGLSRTNQRALPNEMEFRFNPTRGQIVDAYVIDTGVRCTHDEFTNRPNRCEHGHDSTGEGPGDENGHGTHVGGTIAGAQYGFCKNCEVIEVKVLGRSGSGTFAGVIDGINYVANRHGTRRSVANMSLGGGVSQAVNDATNACVAAGVTVVVSSGNGNTNACNQSPASAEHAITVNSIMNTDARSSFSNFGTCSDIFAPGTNVLSAWSTSDSATSTISGTSMSAPHVAGVACELLAEAGQPEDPQEVKDRLSETSTKDVVTNPGAGSPNELLYYLDEDC